MPPPVRFMRQTYAQAARKIAPSLAESETEHSKEARTETSGAAPDDDLSSLCAGSKRKLWFGGPLTDRPVEMLSP